LFRFTIFWEKIIVIIEALRADVFTIIEEGVEWCCAGETEIASRAMGAARA
jgi:hypothetical protein